MSGPTKQISRIGVVFWGDADGIGSLLEETFSDLGYETRHFRYDESIPLDLDLILCYAPFGSMVPLTMQLEDMDPQERPLFAFWLTEPLPNPAIPTKICSLLGRLRSWGERWAYAQGENGRWQIKNGWRWLTARGHRFRYVGDLKYLDQQALLTVLAVSSPILIDYLRGQGLSPIHAYMGAHPSYGADLQLTRDIPVLWMGKIASRRRNQLLKKLRRELKERGINLLVVDGVENPYVFGDARTELLNRTRIVLNLLRTKYDDNSMRFYLAAANRALIVSEPLLPHTPFKDGIHLVESPIDQLTDKIAYYLKHEEACDPIVEQAYDLAVNELTFKNGAQVLMNAVAAAVRSPRHT